MGTVASPTDCLVCTEEFDATSICPRILACSHTFCSLCLDNLITNKKNKCPMCQKEFSARSSKDFTINRAVLDLISLLREENKREMTIPDVIKTTLKANGKLTVKCRATENQMKKTIEEMKAIETHIAIQNACTEHEILSQVLYFINQNYRALQKLKQTRMKLEYELSQTSVKLDALNNVKTKLETDPAETFEEIGPHLDESLKQNNDIKSWLNNIKQISTHSLDRGRKDVNSIITTVNIIVGALRSFAEGGEERIPFPDMKSVSIPRDNMSEYVTTEALVALPLMKSLVEEEKLYAVQRSQGKTRYAKLSFKDSKTLYLHHLTDRKQPANAYMLEYQDIMRKVTPSPKCTFITLGSLKNGKTLGTLIVRLTNTSKRAKNFQLLCSGETGVSYINTTVLSAFNMITDGASVRFGDYECHDMTGGRALIPGAGTERNGILEQPWTAGRVTGDWVQQNDAVAAQFEICLKDRPGKVLNPSFGIVEDGLEVLIKAIHSHSDVKDIVICECGIVLTPL